MCRLAAVISCIMCSLAALISGATCRLFSVISVIGCRLFSGNSGVRCALSAVISGIWCALIALISGVRCRLPVVIFRFISGPVVMFVFIVDCSLHIAFVSLVMCWSHSPLVFVGEPHIAVVVVIISLSLMVLADVVVCENFIVVVVVDIMYCWYSPPFLTADPQCKNSYILCQLIIFNIHLLFMPSLCICSSAFFLWTQCTRAMDTLWVHLNPFGMPHDDTNHCFYFSCFLFFSIAVVIFYCMQTSHYCFWCGFMCTVHYNGSSGHFFDFSLLRLMWSYVCIFITMVIYRSLIAAVNVVICVYFHCHGHIRISHCCG